MHPDRRKCLFPKDANVPSMNIKLASFAEYSKVIKSINSWFLNEIPSKYVTLHCQGEGADLVVYGMLEWQSS